MLNRGEKVTFMLGGHAFVGVVEGAIGGYGYGLMVSIWVEGEFIAVPENLLTRVGGGYQIGDIVEHSPATYKVLEVRPQTLKVEVLTVYGRPALPNSIRILKRSTLQHAIVRPG